MTEKETLPKLYMEQTLLEYQLDQILKDIEVFDKILSKQKSKRQFDKSRELMQDIINTQHIIIKKLCEYSDQIQEHRDIQLEIIFQLSESNKKKGE